MTDFESFVKDLKFEIEALGGFPEEFTEDNAEELLCDLATDHNAHYYHGVSKAVIVFDNDDCVIKIPFNGYTHETYNPDIDDYEYEFVPFQCAGQSIWDYCATEAHVYQDAVDAGVADYFPETAFFESICGYPLYVQPKVVEYYDRLYAENAVFRHSEEERNSTLKYCCDSGHYTKGLNLDWLTDFLEGWGQEALNKLLDFLDYNCISDLHDQNIGYFNGKAIILDYSDYMDGCD